MANLAIIAAANEVISIGTMSAPRRALIDHVRTLFNLCNRVHEHDKQVLMVETRAFHAIGVALMNVKRNQRRNTFSYFDYADVADWIEDFVTKNSEFAEAIDRAHSHPLLLKFWESLEMEYYDSDAMSGASDDSDYNDVIFQQERLHIVANRRAAAAEYIVMREWMLEKHPLLHEEFLEHMQSLITEGNHMHEHLADMNLLNNP